jgi:Protein of unknown function (DUF3501)
MTGKPHRIQREDLLPAKEYEAIRKQRRAEMVALKQHRRVEVGPVATFYFENYDTMLQQIQEMLYIEKGGEEQIEDELAAYNPLVPKGSELVCTLMFEIEDPVRRERILRTLSFIERHTFLQVGGARIMAVPEPGEDRTREDGKTSSVHFLHFPFTPAQIAAFRDPVQSVMLGFEHENYAHMALLTPQVRAALAGDFDA